MKGLSAQVQLKEEWDRVSLTVEDRWRVKKVGYGTFWRRLVGSGVQRAQ